LSKYINSPETLLYQKGRLLFGIHEAKREIISRDLAVVVEGQVDVISLSEAGVRNVVAPLGTAFTEDQARLLRRLASTAVLIFDGDKAGNEAAKKAFILLSRAGCVVKRCVLPAGLDPDSFIQTKGIGALEELIANAQSYVETEIGYLNPTCAEDRVSAVNRVAELISHLDEQVMRDAMVSLAAVKFQTTVEEIAKKIPSKKEGRANDGKPITIGREWIKVLFAAVVQREGAASLWQATNWKDYSSAIKGVAVLEELLTCRFQANDKPSVIAAISDKSPALEKCVVQSLEYPLSPAPTEEIIASCHKELRRDYLAAKLSRLKTHLTVEPSKHKEIMPQIMEVWKELQEVEKVA